jgi:hypothetical protein
LTGLATRSTFVGVPALGDEQPVLLTVRAGPTPR